jgi:uncharacterized membrane protein YfcA
VDWPLAAAMAVSAVLGGRYGAQLARRTGPQVVRWTVIAVGLGVEIWQLVR